MIGDNLGVVPIEDKMLEYRTWIVWWPQEETSRCFVLEVKR